MCILVMHGHRAMETTEGLVQHCVYCIVVFRGELKYLTSSEYSVAEPAQ